ncbi:MAG: hypothetical protein K1X55_13225 [Chitinophagales bacterium]|nr:hypothetical protein [Chitinophagales bacterium]
MNTELTKYLFKKIKTDDYKSQDYPDIDTTKQTNLVYYKVRGSIRLLLKRVLTPFDVQKLANKILSKKLP